ncbi:nucleoside hydrolase [Gordonia sp. zg691]|uniref:Nucleoside hydrolase n=1 Tax=Gordonia jinghuaiqii TaxID=2758710 RepID=A0A7D7QHZ0_9ACTN|nr:nucleoside hydrolase [Gordonia jinghuaiqii]MBD0862936.1 nucleoside hydrolase [Gordonia jinghuaiqii]MCR5978939.1 nucleoside hydrolase [Gordonia jinghuaiqii]QMT01724.1 nucleoside hydrolase [Gordonia jinghuaiqii]
MRDEHVYYVDCDPGIDDALALIYLTRSSVSLTSVGAVAGNVGVFQAAENARRLLALIGRADIPVAIGRQEPVRGRFWGGAQFIHGPNGIAGLDLSASARPFDEMTAPDRLVDLAHRLGRRMRIIALGPLTNIAVALSLEPRLPQLVGGITIMGGAHDVAGNITQFAEANIYADPVAAQQVLSTPWDDLMLVPLDITNHHSLSRAEVGLLRESADPDVHTIALMLDHYLDGHPEFDGTKCLLHDPLATAIAIGSIGLSHAPRCTIRVEIDGIHRGRTLVDVDATSNESATPGHRIALASTAPFAPLLMTTLDPSCPARPSAAV